MKALLVVLALVITSTAFAADNLADKVNAALAADARPAEDIARDKNRKPLETLTFFGLKDDMKVLELLPGSGWYTRVLAPVLADNGEYYVALRTDNVKDGVLQEAGFEDANLLETDGNVRRDNDIGAYVIDAFSFDETDFDMVLTFRNQHNFLAESRATLNTAVFGALKSGGLYGVVDHTRRHMEPRNSENRRRLDPVLVTKEILDAGFELVDYSDLHYRADDELEYEVGRRSVSGNTDRFTLLFRKP